MRIQNLDTIFLKLTPETDEVFLPKERFLKQRNVSYLLPFGAGNFLSVAPDGVPLVADTTFVSDYIDVHEANKDYKAYNMNLSLLSWDNFKRYPFDCVLDLDLTVIKLKDNQLTDNCYLPVCAIYTTEADEINTPVANSVSFVCPLITPGRIKLTDIGGYQLNGKRIKKITCVNVEECYITIRTKDNKNNINDLPLMLLLNGTQFADDDISFDSLDIDTDNSYITVTGNKEDNLILTFKY